MFTAIVVQDSPPGDTEQPWLVQRGWAMKWGPQGRSRQRAWGSVLGTGLAVPSALCPLALSRDLIFLSLMLYCVTSWWL